MRTLKKRFPLLTLFHSLLLATLLQACTTTESSSEASLQEDDLDASVAVSDDSSPITAADENGPTLASESRNIMQAADEDVVDYAIADYKSFDPAGIIVHFDFDNTSLTAEIIDGLDRIVAGMQKDPLARISVRGHADKQGTADYNKSLSGRRAKAIEDYLVSKGIEKDRMNPISMGDSDPVEEGDSIRVFKKNRRGDFTINYGPSAFGKAP